MIIALAVCLGQLPQLPKAGPSVIRVPRLISGQTVELQAKFGLKVGLFADGLDQPRKMAVAPNGDVFVVETRLEIAKRNQPNRVVVLPQNNQSGRPAVRAVWAEHLNLPFGILFGFGHLYVANTDSVVRWSYKAGQLRSTGKPEVVLRGIPSRGYRNHWTRNILLSRDAKHLFLSIGSEENLAEEGPRRAVIERYPLANGLVSGSPEIFASGLRNPIGLALFPKTGELWASVAERDYRGDNLVPDFVTSIKRGGFYGWPYAFIGPHHDPKMPRKPELEKRTLVPNVLLPAHTTPIDLLFTRRGVIVTLHGSQNRSRLNGYKVVFIPLSPQGKPTGPAQDLVTGWLPKGSNREILGRPAGLARLGDRTILVADDWGGKIWRLSGKFLEP